jgi:hypothetical protein
LGLRKYMLDGQIEAWLGGHKLGANLRGIPHPVPKSSFRARNSSHTSN